MRFVPVSSVKGKIAVFDVETTGLNPKISEVLQLAIVDEDGVVLDDFYDVHVDSWPEAEAINGISKKMVSGYPYLSEEADKVTEILARYDVLVGYNISFDVEFLKRAGVKIPRAAIVDLMQDFSIFKDEYVLKRWKLSEAASWAGYDMMKKHDAVYDSQATLALFNKMQEVLRCSTARSAGSTAIPGVSKNPTAGTSAYARTAELGRCFLPSMTALHGGLNVRTENHFFPVVSNQYGQFDIQPSFVDAKLESATVMFCKGNKKQGWRYSAAQLLGLAQTLKCIRYMGKCDNSEEYHIFAPEACQTFGDSDENHQVLAWFELSDAGVGLNYTNLIELTDAIDSLFARYNVVEQ